MVRMRLLFANMRQLAPRTRTTCLHADAGLRSQVIYTNSIELYRYICVDHWCMWVGSWDEKNSSHESD